MNDLDVGAVRAAHVPLECVNVRCSVMFWCGGCDPDGDDPCSAHPWPCPSLLAADPNACIGVDPNCADCVAEIQAGQRGGQGHHCDGLCDLTRSMINRGDEMHQLIHRPETCRGCGGVLNDKRGMDRTATKTCPEGCCRIWYCPDCGTESGSDGLLGCPSCSPVEAGPAEGSR